MILAIVILLSVIFVAFHVTLIMAVCHAAAFADDYFESR